MVSKQDLKFNDCMISCISVVVYRFIIDIASIVFLLVSISEAAKTPAKNLGQLNFVNFSLKLLSLANLNVT